MTKLKLYDNCARLEEPLEDKQNSDLVDLFDIEEAYVNVHILTSPNGEIRGTDSTG